MAQAGSLWIKLGLSTKDFEKSLKNAEKNLKNFGNRLNDIGSRLTVGLSIPLALVSGAAIKLGMDAVESENLFSVSMGKMASSARTWSEDLRKNLGLNSYEVRKNVGTFNVMLTSMGLTEKAAFDMSKGLTQLAYDMASFYNLNPEEAFAKLQSGISGESEPLKRLGILVNETTTKNYALTHGMIKQGEQLSETGKVAARYGTIMEATSKAQGDLSRTLDSPANKMRILQAQIQQTAIDLGIALLPAFQSLMKAADPFIQAIKKIADWFSKLNPEVQKNIGYIIALTIAVGPLIQAFGLLYKTASGVMGALRLISPLSKLVISGFGNITFAISSVAGGAATATEAVGFLAKSFTPFLAFTGILTVLYNIANAFSIMAENARVAKMEISGIKSVTDLEKKRQQLTAEQTRLENKKKAASGGDTKGGWLAGGIGGWSSSDQAALDKVNKSLSQVDEQQKKINLAKKPKGAAPTITVPDISGLELTASKTGGENKALQQESFIAEWAGNLQESKAALLKNIDDIATTKKKALDEDEKKALNQAKKQGIATTNIENTFANRRAAIEQELSEQKRQFNQQWSDELLQSQISNTKNVEENFKLQLKANENAKNEEIRIATEKGLATDNIIKTYAEHAKTIEKSKTDTIRNFDLDWKGQALSAQTAITDNVDENARLQLKILDDEKAEKIRIANEEGMAVADIEKTYSLKRKAIEKQLAEDKLQFNRTWQEKLTSLYGSSQDITNLAWANDLEDANKKGYDVGPINKYYQAIMSQDFWERWNLGLKEGLRNLKTWGDSAQQLASDVAQGMESFFETSFFDAWQGKLSDISEAFQNFINSITQSIAKMLANQATQSLLGLFGTSALGGSTSPTVAMGSPTSIPPHASGGSVSGNKTILVGEKGPELFVPSSSGSIITNSQLAAMNQGPRGSGGSGGGNVSVNLINNSGIQTTAKVTSKKSDSMGNQAITLVMEAVAKNAGGSKDFFKALGKA
jgi:lambda family phage tail tape measure protein